MGVSRPSGDSVQDLFTLYSMLAHSMYMKESVHIRLVMPQGMPIERILLKGKYHHDRRSLKTNIQAEFPSLFQELLTSCNLYQEL